MQRDGLTFYPIQRVKADNAPEQRFSEVMGQFEKACFVDCSWTFAASIL